MTGGWTSPSTWWSSPTGSTPPPVGSSGRGGWVVWAPEDADPDLGSELWGQGFFVGAYPVQGRLGVFLGGPHGRTAIGPAEFATRARRALRTVPPRIDSCLTAVASAEDPY